MLFVALLVATADPLFDQQRSLPMIKAPAAWRETTGDDAQRIGIVDTGLVRDHEEIVGKDAGGYDFLDGDADYSDTDPNGVLFHGTHVAGIIAASGDDGKGIAGIDWNAKVVMARALSGVTGGPSTAVMNGALWLAGGHVDGVPDIDKPVDVINMSLGFPGACDPTSQQIVNEILQRGVPIVAATGNHGADFGGTTDDTVQTPANCDGVISVGAVDYDGNVTAYTNATGNIDVVAPGGTHEIGILSLGAGPDQYVAQQGTSMATPHVTGVVALMLAEDPTLKPAAIRALLKALPACPNCAGHPLLDAKKALDLVTNGNPAGPTDLGGCASTSSSTWSALVALCAVLVRVRRRRA